MGPARSAHRFRRRLTAAFVLVAAISAGVLATATFVFAREYRWRNFRNASLDESRIALALAPASLDAAGFDRLRAVYETRSDADMVVVTPSEVFSSSPALGVSDVPTSLAELPSQGADIAETHVGGRPTLVVGMTGPASRYYFFYSLAQLEDSLDELARVAVLGWVFTVAVAGAFGQVVARATLRPVGEVAQAAEAIAAGNLSARLPVPSEDEFGGLAGSFNHMADEVQALVAKLEDAAARERRFTADVAHELRTPLTGMTATASVLADFLEEMPAEARRSATVLVSDVRRLRDLVAELLELSRLDATTGELGGEPLRVRDAFEAVIRGADVRREANVVLDGDGDEMVLAEPIRLRRILANLLDNAVVHGGGCVRVSWRRDRDHIVIDVADRGSGIPHGDLTRVFDRFYKSDRSRARGGSGLGLAIARQHALAQEGELTAANMTGGGAVFTLRLPAATLDDDTGNGGAPS